MLSSLTTTSLIILFLFTSSILASPLIPRQATNELPADHLLSLDDINTNVGKSIIPDAFHVDPLFGDTGLDQRTVYIAIAASLLRLARLPPDAEISPHTFNIRGIIIEIHGGAAGFAPIRSIQASFGLHEIIRAMYTTHTFNAGNFLMYERDQAIGFITFRKRDQGVDDSITPTLNNYAEYLEPQWGNQIVDYEFFIPFCSMTTLLSRVPEAHRSRAWPLPGPTLKDFIPSWNLDVIVLSGTQLTQRDIVGIVEHSLNNVIDQPADAPVKELIQTLNVKDNADAIVATWALHLLATPPELQKPYVQPPQTPEMHAIGEEVNRQNPELFFPDAS